MTVGVRQSLRFAGWRDDVRLGRVALTLGVSTALQLLALQVPPFMMAGADLADGGQRDYAASIWKETQTSLALVGIVLPWPV